MKAQLLATPLIFAVLLLAWGAVAIVTRRRGWLTPLGTAVCLTGLVPLALTGSLVVAYPLWSDEVEHLHCAWLLSQGQLPYVDFWEHHPPLLWQGMQFSFPLLPESMVTVWVWRVIATALLLGTAVAVGELVWRWWFPQERRAAVYAASGLVVLGTRASALLGPVIRADVFAGLLSCVALWAAWRAAESRALRWPVIAGATAALAIVFSPRFAGLVLLWPIAAVVSVLRPTSLPPSRSEKGGRGNGSALAPAPPEAGGGPGGRRHLLAGAALFAASGLVVVGLQGWWLAAHGILNQCLFWVFRVNTTQSPHGGAFFVLRYALHVHAAFGLFWVLGLWRWRRRLPASQWALLAVAPLPGALLPYLNPGSHFYALWPAVVTGAPVVIAELLERCRELSPQRLQSWLVLLGVAWLAAGPLAQPYFYNARPIPFRRGLRCLARMLEASRGQKVLCVVPYHPIFCQDATPLWHPYQLDSAHLQPRLRQMTQAALAQVWRCPPTRIDPRAMEDLVAAGTAADRARWARLRPRYRRVVQCPDGLHGMAELKSEGRSQNAE